MSSKLSSFYQYRIWPLRIVIFLFALLAPFWLLNFLALVFSIPPLGEPELLRVLNFQQLGYEILNYTCGDSLKQKTADHHIVTFGGSSTHGAFASPGADFSHVLERRLALRFPRQWSVHNLGVSAKNSFWMKECAKIVAKTPADYWIVYEGHNDFINLYATGVNRTIFLYENPRLTSGLNWLLHQPLAGFMRPFLAARGVNTSYADHQKDLQNILLASERNYREIIAHAKSAKVKLVLTTAISRLDWVSVVTDLKGTPEDKGANALIAEATEAFQAGQKDEALRLFRLARDRDIYPFRAPSSFNEMMRRLAKEESETVSLLDLEKLFESEFKNEIIGCRFFGQNGYCDQIHPNDFTHEWMAKKLEQHLFGLAP